MTRKPPPQHGERRCYIAGCRRPECAAANAAYCKQYRVTRYRTGPKRVDAGPYADRVRRYADLGWSRRQIAEQAGISETTIVDLLSGHAKRLNPDSAAAIRTLPAEPTDVPGRAYFDATGTIRRGRALYRIGHRVVDMAAELGLHADSLSLILHRDSGLVLASTAHAMDALYKRLRWTPGKFLANRTRATKRDWHGPFAWTADTIDDPSAKPDVDEPYRPMAANGRDSLRLPEVRHLLALGESEASIARQMGGSEKYIRDLISKDRNRRPAAAA
ncbi:multiprotein-bridging factor 1 family protein [Streptomyces sp. NPDC051310]|uniref:multiprotein-bridging factor 1 family protein n=1 Tax=Streptomyces sp. NPDC051310 TaxID=3365649 RepID=UPI0037BA221E